MSQYDESLIEAALAKERIRRTMEDGLFRQIEESSKDDHYYIAKVFAPIEHWVDSVAVQVLIKCDLIKMPNKIL